MILGYFFLIKKILGMQIPEVNKYQDCTYHQIETTFAISNKIVHCQKIAKTAVCTFNWEAQPIYKTSNEESEGSMVGVTI